MCGAVGAGAAALLAACGSSGGDTGSGTEDSGSGDQTDSGAPEVIAAVDDIPVGGGLATAGLVLVQPEAGNVLAFDAACPHQGTQLPAPQDGVITCPSHVSQFDAADGSLLQGPATEGLTEVPVTVEDGQVFRA